jgi:hypothetical protein
VARDRAPIMSSESWHGSRTGPATMTCPIIAYARATSWISTIVVFAIRKGGVA